MDHFLKFLVVGTIGFVINTTVLIFGVRIGFAPSLSGPIGAEIAILSNFLLNNFWTFSDKTITKISDYPTKFIQFNILSLGSVAIQFLFLKAGEKIFTMKRFKEPFVEEFPIFRNQQVLRALISLPVVKTLAPKFSGYFVFYMFGIGVGLIVNYIVYSQIIWK